MADHCSNIAVCMLRVSEDDFETHEYLDVLKAEQAEWFRSEFTALAKQYALPEKTEKSDKSDKSDKKQEKKAEKKRKEKQRE